MKVFSVKKVGRDAVLKYLRWVLALALIGVLVSGIGWLTSARPPLPEAMESLKSDDLVTVREEPWQTFTPTQHTPETAFIFYPGGRVDPRAYASLMRRIAMEGYLVVVPSMPFNIAILASSSAEKIVTAYPEIDHWVIGGHSVGGTAAALYTDKAPQIIEGLAIWASYPSDGTDISDQDIPVLSIYGSREVRVNDESVGKRKHLLPEDTRYVRIEGGDHHQFGSYEIEPKDHLATTSRSSQHQHIIEAMLALLHEVSRGE